MLCSLVVETEQRKIFVHLINREIEVLLDDTIERGIFCIAFIVVLVGLYFVKLQDSDYVAAVSYVAMLVNDWMAVKKHGLI